MLSCRLSGLDFSFLFFKDGILWMAEGDNLSEGPFLTLPYYAPAFVGTPGHDGRSQCEMSSSIHGLGTMTLPTFRPSASLEPGG